VATRLKWPNDLLVDGRKLGGILAERVELAAAGRPGVVVGLGLNVDLPHAALPTPQATSLLLAGAAQRDRTRLLADILARLETWYEAWGAARGDAGRSGVAAAYRRRCATLGCEVTVTLPVGRLDGQASGVDEDGALLVRTGDGPLRRVTAGDVVHVRAGGAG
jgi:BirA family biotin operon repressor/biotin-[acetyl-CoA-carboxylase] ligase